jgi:hypothetical protein
MWKLKHYQFAALEVTYLLPVRLLEKDREELQSGLGCLLEVPDVILLQVRH